MVVDMVRPQDAADAVLDSHVPDRQKKRGPGLIERQKWEERKIVKLHFDIATGDVDQPGGRGHQSEADRKDLNRRLPNFDPARAAKTARLDQTTKLSTVE
jgi:hypothetical protein